MAIKGTFTVVFPQATLISDEGIAKLKAACIMAPPLRPAPPGRDDVALLSLLWEQAGAWSLLDPTDTTHETLTTDEPMDYLSASEGRMSGLGRLADAQATFAAVCAMRAQADLVASIRSEWDNLPDAEPEGIVRRRA
jgi:hypothetical protein